MRQLKTFSFPNHPTGLTKGWRPSGSALENTFFAVIEETALINLFFVLFQTKSLLFCSRSALIHLKSLLILKQIKYNAGQTQVQSQRCKTTVFTLANHIMRGHNVIFGRFPCLMREALGLYPARLRILPESFSILILQWTTLKSTAATNVWPCQLY